MFCTIILESSNTTSDLLNESGSDLFSFKMTSSASSLVKFFRSCSSNRRVFFSAEFTFPKEALGIALENSRRIVDFIRIFDVVVVGP